MLLLGFSAQSTFFVFRENCTKKGEDTLAREGPAHADWIPASYRWMDTVYRNHTVMSTLFFRWKKL
jgi:hypothetical protein